MDLKEKNPPREFSVTADKQITIKDCGQVLLQPNEQVSFTTQSGKEHDFLGKDWGFYATPSVNCRLKNEGFKTALVRNVLGQIYIMVVDTNKMVAFKTYCAAESQEVLEWLDERPLKGEG